MYVNVCNRRLLIIYIALLFQLWLILFKCLLIADTPLMDDFVWRQKQHLVILGDPQKQKFNFKLKGLKRQYISWFSVISASSVHWIVNGYFELCKNVENCSWPSTCKRRLPKLLTTNPSKVQLMSTIHAAPITPINSTSSLILQHSLQLGGMC